MSRMSEFHRQLSMFNQMIAPHFSMKPIEKHTFEEEVKGVTVDVVYHTRFDRLEQQDEVLFQTVTILHDGDDISDLIKPEIYNGLIKKVEAHFERRGEDHSRDWQ